MSMEKLDHVVVGVLFDFMGFLTTRTERTVLSSYDDAAPAVTAIQEFLKLRGVENCEPLHGWERRCGGSSVAGSNRPTSVYVASRASVPERPEMWRNLRANGLPVSSTWIDEAGDGETKDFGELWTRIESEVRGSDCLILYVEPEDLPLKGALVEVGMALAMEKPVAIVLGEGLALESGTFRPLGSWAAHPRCRIFSDMDMALVGMGFSTTQGTVGCKDPINCNCQWPGMLKCHNYVSSSMVHRPMLFRDGNQWCALSGDNIQEGLCSFGDTPAEAIRSFDSLESTQAAESIDRKGAAMQAIERIRKIMLEYYSASGIQEEQEALTRMKFIAGPVLFREVLAHIDKLEAEAERLRKDAERMREALTFYAQGDHFNFDDEAWDTVSGEPQNFWCDEAGTATVEDGTIAKLAIELAMKGTP